MDYFVSDVEAGEVAGVDEGGGLSGFLSLDSVLPLLDSVLPLPFSAPAVWLASPLA